LLVLSLAFWTYMSQVCFFLPRIHQTTNASDGDENDLLLWSRQPLLWSALMLQAPSAPPWAGSSYWIDFIPIPNSS
jgi:hypothetical protein